MAELVRANVIANLAYYRRSRLLLAFLLVFLVITGLQSLPPLFAHSGVQTFNALQDIFSNLNGFLLLLAAGLGLFIISSHLRNRSLKMVFTKPCTPAVWLGSAWLSAVTVSFLLNGIVLGSALVLSLLWHVPVRVGLAFVSVDTLCSFTRFDCLPHAAGDSAASRSGRNCGPDLQRRHVLQRAIVDAGRHSLGQLH